MRAIKIYYDANSEDTSTVRGYRVLHDDRAGRNDLQMIMALTNRNAPWLRLDAGRLDVNRIK